MSDLLRETLGRACHSVEEVDEKWSDLVPIDQEAWRRVGDRLVEWLDAADFVITPRASLAELEKALKPFAAHATMWPHEEDNLTVSCRLHVQPAYEAILGTEDFRRAGAALHPAKTHTEGGQ